MPSPSDMDRIRERINEIIAAMARRAARDKWTQEKLFRVYDSVIAARGRDKRRPKAMRPTAAATYDRLFGFDENARAYLPRGTRGELHSVTRRHIECIQAVLKKLNILRSNPPINNAPSSWLSFLNQALAEVECRSFTKERTAAAIFPKAITAQIAPLARVKCTQASTAGLDACHFREKRRWMRKFGNLVPPASEELQL